MASKAVVQQQKITTSIQAAAETHAEAAAHATETLLSPYLREGEKMPDVALLVRLAGRLLEDSTRKLVVADEAHERELSDDVAPRERRDESSQSIYSRLVDLRDALVGVYGTRTAEAAGFTERTPRDPVLLARFARKVVDALPGVTLPEPRIKGASLDPKNSTAGLAELLATLDTSLKEVARETREAEQTLVARNDAMSTQVDHASGVASVLSGIFRLAGLDELAERVRPSARRTASSTPEETPPQPAS